jgi:putative transposase
MQSITWLAKKQYPLHGRVLIWGWLGPRITERPTSRAKADEPVIEVLNQVVAKNGRWGFRLCFDWMRNQGYALNHKRVWRIYKEMGLNLPRRTKKRIPKMPKVPLVAPNQSNTMWALDFMYDTLHYGRPFRAHNVIDESNREILAIEIDISLSAARVVRTLEQLEEIHGLPQSIRLDNGSELRSAVFMGWCESKGIELQFIQPGKPSQNAFIERFNKTYRHEVLNAYLFENLREVREITEHWITIYNEERPHSSLGRIPPKDYRAQAENNTLGMSA